MTRARYRITGADRPFVEAYLARKLRREPGCLADARGVREFDPTRFDLIELNGWCERWLTRKQWQQLKASVRAARKRNRDGVSAPQGNASVKLHRDAWRILSDLAKREGLTLSAFIVQRHQAEWLAMQPSHKGGAT